jgi:hypothetical protein
MVLKCKRYKRNKKNRKEKKERETIDKRASGIPFSPAQKTARGPARSRPEPLSPSHLSPSDRWSLPVGTISSNGFFSLSGN